MEHQAQCQINRILDRVRSLDDLSADDVIELRSLFEQSIVLEKFKVARTEYWNWLDKIGDDICGVEYDAQNACIVLKGCPGWMHEAVADAVYEVFYQIRDRLSAATGSRYILTGSKCEYDLEPIYCLFSLKINLVLGCKLVSKYSRSSKEADASVSDS
jgi:hypothetical protein